MTVREITSKNEFDLLLAGDTVFFIDFYANWCGPCKQISPLFERLAGEHIRDGVGFYKVNIDDVPEIADQLGIRSIPTFHAYKGAERLDTVVGANPARLTTFIQARVNA